MSKSLQHGSVLDTISEEAHELWENNKNWSRKRWLNQLSPKQHVAVLLACMHSQICNGGVRQWVDNGYACESEDLFDMMEMIDTPRVIEWRDKLKLFVDVNVNTTIGHHRRVNLGFGSDYWNRDVVGGGDEDGEFDEEIELELEALDDFYYSEPFRSDFLQEIDQYLVK